MACRAVDRFRARPRIVRSARHPPCNLFGLALWLRQIHNPFNNLLCCVTPDIWHTPPLNSAAANHKVVPNPFHRAETASSRLRSSCQPPAPPPSLSPCRLPQTLDAVTRMVKEGNISAQDAIRHANQLKNVKVRALVT